MVKSKARRMRGSSGIRSASKGQQDKLKKRAKKLAENPQLLIPDCIGECRGCDFDKLSIKLNRISKYRGNTNALQKLAKSGGQLERAYAVMLILDEEGAPLLGVARMARGEVSYAMRGKVNKEILIGVQHYDDVKFGLLAYSDLAIKKNLHLYYTAKGVQCSGKFPDYPKGLIKEVIDELDYSLSRSGSTYRCQHCTGGNIGSKLTLRIRSADTTIQLCSTCLKDKENLFMAFTNRALTKNPEGDFDIDLDYSLTCISDNCSVGELDIRTKILIKNYTTGQISDRVLMDSYSEEVMKKLHDVRKRLLVIGGRCFEDDSSKFIEALRPSKIEKKALQEVLSKSSGPIIIESGTASAVLSLFWEDHGVDAIDAVINDKGLAKEIYKSTSRSGKTPSHILRDAHTRKGAEDALGQLPDLKKLPRLSKFADGVVRTYKAYGPEEAVKAIEKGQGGDTKMKSISCGFYDAMGLLKGKEWLFTKEELDYGRYLSEFSKSLLDAEPDNYKEALQNLMTASGSGDTI